MQAFRSVKRPKAKLVILSFVLLTLFSRVANAQNESILKHLSIKAENLNTTQRGRLEKLNNHNIYKSIHFVETQDPELVQDNGLLKLELPYIACPDLHFAVANVEKTNENNYQWYGQTVEKPDYETDSLCGSGSLTIMKNNGLIIGHITLENRSFELYDLTGGVQALCETDLSLFTAEECAADMDADSIAYRTNGSDPCEVATTKVLVLYTPAALNYETDITGKANLAISQLNNIWANSGINNSLYIASIQPLSFTEGTNGIMADVIQLSNNTTAQN
ncbi:hypothetical protein I5M27_00125 [Adhaeribacter sp. BT258]|uniref:Uncharacterized protein n=1 Tax=Adhaeribacter terrigena TaxID=2793070 RepID=A0ABS1BWE7_9BACT|nr:hypothetical protein [Adhaeribacter terrigena]MBK0401369.1 hypothetical protein [Adhaeribacter terrigena]